MTENDDRKQKVIDRLLSKPGRKGAVDAMCVHCIYDPEHAGSGGWRGQVAACTTTNCPLYKYRPMPTSGKESD